MLKTNPVKLALKEGRPVIGTMITEAGSTGYVWMLANLGYDFVFIDMEHSAYGLQPTADMIKIARLSGLVPLVRVTDLAYNVIAPVLDAGAMGLMLPIGPFDLTISLGAEATNSPVVEAAIDRVVEAANRHHVASGIHIADPAAVLKWYKRGMTLLGCNTDLGFFADNANKTLVALREGTGTSATQDVNNIHV